jgi:hypothetical protein
MSKRDRLNPKLNRCCAPIDRPPVITAIGTDAVVEGQDVMAFAAAGRTIAFEVHAKDDNLNDKVTLNYRTN